MTILLTTDQTQAEARAIITETVVWNGITIMASYEADWMQLAVRGLDYPSAHLELQVVSPKGAPLPVTDTGYRSEFLPSGIVEDAGGVVEFTLGWLDAHADSKAWRVTKARWNQLDLFEIE